MLFYLLFLVLILIPLFISNEFNMILYRMYEFKLWYWYQWASMGIDSDICNYDTDTPTHKSRKNNKFLKVHPKLWKILTSVAIVDGINIHIAENPQSMLLYFLFLILTPIPLFISSEFNMMFSTDRTLYVFQIVSVCVYVCAYLFV